MPKYWPIITEGKLTVFLLLKHVHLQHFWNAVDSRRVRLSDARRPWEKERETHTHSRSYTTHIHTHTLTYTHARRTKYEGKTSSGISRQTIFFSGRLSSLKRDRQRPNRNDECASGEPRSGTKWVPARPSRCFAAISTHCYALLRTGLMTRRYRMQWLSRRPTLYYLLKIRFVKPVMSAQL